MDKADATPQEGREAAKNAAPSAKAGDEKPLVGEVEKTPAPFLHGVAEKENANSSRLTPEHAGNEGIMHIIQYRVASSQPPPVRLPAEVESTVRPQRAILAQTPERQESIGDKPPLRGQVDDSAPVRMKDQRPQMGLQNEVVPKRGSNQTGREVDGDSSGRPQRTLVAQAPVRSVLSENELYGHLSRPVPAEPAGQTDISDKQNLQQSEDYISEKLKQRKAKKNVPRNDEAVPGKKMVSKEEESLLWDTWYAHVNDLVCHALKTTMPQNGNPAGRCRVHITVDANHHLTASVIQTTSDAFGEAIRAAYMSLDHSQELEFPEGTQRHDVVYESDHIQDVAANPGAFDSQTVHGDREYIK